MAARRSPSLILRSAACAAVVACGAATARSLDETELRHIVAIDSDGAAIPFAMRCPTGEIPDDDYAYTNHLTLIADSIRASGRTNILIYLFGGMNAVQDTVDRSVVLSTTIWQTSDYYPICVGWQSGLFEAYLDHLLWIRRGKRERIMGPVLSPFYLMADIGRAITRLPVTIVYHGYATANDMVLEPMVVDDHEDELNAVRIRADTGMDKTPRVTQVIRRVVYALGFPLRIVTVPLIDACGKNAWDVMIGRTEAAFRKSYTLDVPAGDATEVNFAPPDGALAMLSVELVSLCTNAQRYRVTLVGHSLGAMLANQLIRRYPDMPCAQIVYMGAATSLNDCGTSLGPYLRRHPTCTFYNLCLHQHADEAEYMWLMFLPRGSILEWIDAFLSDPLTLNDLQAGKWKNAVRTLPTLNPELRGQIVIKAFGVEDPEFNTHDLHKPQKHTDFSHPSLRFWEQSFWSLPDEQ